MKTEYDDAVDAELLKWAGVTWSRTHRSKHLALILTFAGETRFVIYPSTPGDSYRGLANKIRDIRTMLRSMGAEREPESHSSAPRRQRNPTEPRRLIIADRCEGGPRRDPWAPLRSMAEGG